MNYLIDKFFIYFESIFKGRLPIKYEGTYIIENICVIHYECLSVNPLNVNESIKSCIRVRYSALHNKFVQLEATDEDFRNLSDLFERTLKAFVSLGAILNKQTIFFNHFKLQDYSEYKKENRDSIINNLIN
jgi:hypothetical protein